MGCLGNSLAKIRIYFHNLSDNVEKCPNYSMKGKNEVIIQSQKNIFQLPQLHVFHASLIKYKTLVYNMLLRI